MLSLQAIYPEESSVLLIQGYQLQPPTNGIFLSQIMFISLRVKIQIMEGKIRRILLHRTIMQTLYTCSWSIVNYQDQYWPDNISICNTQKKNHSELLPNLCGDCIMSQIVKCMPEYCCGCFPPDHFSGSDRSYTITLKWTKILIVWERRWVFMITLISFYYVKNGWWFREIRWGKGRKRYYFSLKLFAEIDLRTSMTCALVESVSRWSTVLSSKPILYCTALDEVLMKFFA